MSLFCGVSSITRTSGSMSGLKRTTLGPGWTSAAETGGRLLRKTKLPRPARAPTFAVRVRNCRRWMGENMFGPRRLRRRITGGELIGPGLLESAVNHEAEDTEQQVWHTHHQVDALVVSPCVLLRVVVLRTGRLAGGVLSGRASVRRTRQRQEHQQRQQTKQDL